MKYKIHVKKMKYYAVYQFLFPIHEAFLYEFHNYLKKELQLISTDEFINMSFGSQNNVFIFLVSYTAKRDDPRYLSKMKSEKSKGNRIVFYNDIELNMPDVYHKHILKKDMYKLYDQIWSYDDSHKSLIENVKVPFYYVPYGYSKYYENCKNDVQLEYDFLFFGRTSKYGHYRKMQLEILKKHGLNVKIVTDKYGDDLLHELSKAKIILNIKSGENIIDLDFPRYSLLVGLNKFFLTDTYNDKSGVEDTLKGMFDFQFCKNRDDMITKAKEYVKYPIEKLNDLSKDGYEKYKVEYSNYLECLKGNDLFK